MSSTLHPNVLRWGRPKAMWQLRTRMRWRPASASTRWWPAGAVAPPTGTRWWPAGAVREEVQGFHNPSCHIHVYNNTSDPDVHTPTIATPTVHGTEERDGEVQDSEKRDSEVQDSEERDRGVQDAFHNPSCHIHVHNTSDHVHTPTASTGHGIERRDSGVQDSEERYNEVQDAFS